MAKHNAAVMLITPAVILAVCITKHNNKLSKHNNMLKIKVIIENDFMVVGGYSHIFFVNKFFSFFISAFPPFLYIPLCCSSVNQNKQFNIILLVVIF